MNVENIRRFQERARQIQAQLEPIRIVPLLKPEIPLCASSPQQIILRRKLRILKGLIRMAMLREIDRRGWRIRDGEAYMKKWFNHWCGTLSLNHIDSVRSEMRAIMKETPDISIEEALVVVFWRRDREYDLYGDVPTFLRRDIEDEK